MALVRTSDSLSLNSARLNDQARKRIFRAKREILNAPLIYGTSVAKGLASLIMQITVTTAAGMSGTNLLIKNTLIAPFSTCFGQPALREHGERPVSR